MRVDCLWRQHRSHRCSRIPLLLPSFFCFRRGRPAPQVAVPSFGIRFGVASPPIDVGCPTGRQPSSPSSARRTASRMWLLSVVGLSGRCRRRLLQQRLLRLLQHVPQDDLLMRVVGLRAGRQRRRTRDRPTRIDLFGAVRAGPEQRRKRPPSDAAITQRQCRPSATAPAELRIAGKLTLVMRAASRATFSPIRASSV